MSYLPLHTVHFGTVFAAAMGNHSALPFYSKILRGHLEIPFKQDDGSYDVCLTRDLNVILVGHCH